MNSIRSALLTVVASVGVACSGGSSGALTEGGPPSLPPVDDLTTPQLRDAVFEHSGVPTPSEQAAIEREIGTCMAALGFDYSEPDPAPGTVTYGYAEDSRSNLEQTPMSPAEQQQYD